MDQTSLPDEVKELVRAQIAEGVAAEGRGELRDGQEAVVDVRCRIDERLRRGKASSSTGARWHPARDGRPSRQVPEAPDWHREEIVPE